MTLGNNATVDEHADNGVPAGRLLIIGGGEDRCCGAGVLERFVALSGGDQARITLVTTATGIPDEVHAEYEQVFRKLGVGQTRELRLRGRADADSDTAAAALRDSTGVFFSGGDQSRILALVGSRASDILRAAPAPALWFARIWSPTLAAAAVPGARGERQDIRRGFATFTPAEASPGRGNVYCQAAVPLVVDYGHNLAALAGMGRLLREAWDGQPIACDHLPGDRRDDPDRGERGHRGHLVQPGGRVRGP